MAGSAAAGSRGEKHVLARSAVAKSAGPVCCPVAFKVSDDKAGAGVIPWNLGDVGLGGTVGGGIGRTPVGAFRTPIDVAKVRSADGHVVRGGRKAADADAVRGRGLVGVTTGGAFVARRNKDGDAFPHSLLVGLAIRGVGGGPLEGVDRKRTRLNSSHLS